MILYVARIIPPEEFGKFAVVISFIAIADSFVSLPFENSIVQSSKLGKRDIDSIWTYSRFLKSLIFFFLFNFFVFNFEFPFLIEEKELYYIASLSILGNGIYNSYISQRIRNIDYKSDMISSFAGRISRLFFLLFLCSYFKNSYALIISWLIEIYLKSFSSYIVTNKKVSICFDIKPLKKHLNYSISAYFVNLVDQLLLNLENLLAVTFIGVKFAGLFQASKRINSEFTADFKMILERILFPFYSRIKKKNNRLLNNIYTYYPLIIYLAGIISLIAFLFIDELIKLILGKNWLDAIILCKIYLIYNFFNIINVQTKSIFKALNIQKYIIYSSVVYLVLITTNSLIFYNNDQLNGTIFVLIVSISLAVTCFINVYFVKIKVKLSLIKFTKNNIVSILSLLISTVITVCTYYYYLRYLDSLLLILTIKILLFAFMLLQFYLLYIYNFSEFKNNLNYIIKKIFKR